MFSPPLQSDDDVDPVEVVLVPEGHVEHRLLPLNAEYDPTGQSSQPSSPSEEDLNIPSSHLSHLDSTSSVPLEQEAVVATQSELDFEPTETVEVLEGHRLHDVLPDDV